MHVTGDVHSGFEHEFVRNDDLRSETRRHVVILIGEVEDCYVNDDGTMDLMGGEERDKTPRDRVEEIALEVPAPGPSMNSASRNSVMFNSFYLSMIGILMLGRHRLDEFERVIVKTGW